jgi:hypothetical protein
MVRRILDAVRRGLVVVVALCGATWVAAACGAPAPAGPRAVTFTAVDLPDAAVPQVLAADGDQLLVGVRRAAAPQPPGLVRRGPDGAITEIPAQAVTGYGRTASWFSLTADGGRILAIGGDRGGAHGNERWSVWTGSGSGVAEHAQTFNTFGGWGAGDLIDGILTPGGAAVVGSWESTEAGLDVAVWTPRGDDWVRRPSTGTPLHSTRAEVAFPTAATGFGPGVAVAGWQVGTGAGGGQVPVVWQSGPGAAGWNKVVLPDAGKAGTSAAIRCAGATCAVAGRVDGVLALWRLADGRWSRVAGLPPIPVGDSDRLAAPLDTDGGLAEVVADGGQVKVVEAGETVETAETRNAVGPTGPVTAAVRVGPSVFVVAGDRLWQADVAALR